MKDALHDFSSNPVDRLFEQSIVGLGIPPCPIILDRFMAEMRKDEPDYHRLATLIGTDVGLSAGLIKTTNSPYFGLRQRVRSVNEALMILGLDTASRAVAGIILRKTFSNAPNLERFWDASSRIARLSGWLTQHLAISDLRPDDAYTFALFRDCGIPVLLGKFPQYEQVLMRANREKQRSFTDVEEEQFPTHHAMVGCLLAQSWWLPEEICLAIRNHHDLSMLQSAASPLPMLSRRLIATAQLSEHIVQHQLGLSLTEEWLKMASICLQILDLREEQLELLYGDAAEIAAASE